MRAFIFSIFFSIFFLSTSFSLLQAQTAPVNGGAAGIPELKEQVSYSVLPSKPKVGDVVDIEAEMFGSPVKNAVFTWNVDGKLYKKEQGLNKISVYINKNTRVTLSILTVSGSTLFKEWVFNPQAVTIFWESNTYTPPFYKGKSLYTPESELKLHGINLDSKNPLTNKYANYVWKVDGVVQGNESGVSRNTYTYQGDILQQEPYFELLYSNVTSYNGSKTTAANTRSVLRVQTLASDIFTYEKTPLLGILFNKKIPTVFPVVKQETTLVTYPVYYSVNSALTPEYFWSLNDTVIKRDSNVLTFKKTKSDQQSRLTISVSNPQSLLQSKDISHIIDTSTKTTEAEEETGFFGK